MQKLHLVGFTTDQKGLILSARRGARSGSFHLTLDDQLAGAVEELRTRQAEEEAEEAEAEQERPPRVESALGVKEIQARLRQGRTVQDVAKAAGVDPEWVERFAAPVFAEQAQVITKVRGTPLRRARLGPSSHAIGDAVRHNLAERGVQLSPEEFTSAWTTRQLADGRWAVRFTFRHRGKNQVLRFDLDERKGSVLAADRASNMLGYVTPPPSAKPRSPVRSRPPDPDTDDRPTAKRATVTTGFRADAASKAVSRPAKERERANAAMRRAALKSAAEAERVAARKAKEKQAEEARRERERKAAEARKARERAAAERAKAAAAKKKAAAAKKKAAEKARQKAAKQAADQARRAEAALVAAERAAATKAKRAAAARKAAKTRKQASKAATKRTAPKRTPARTAARKAPVKKVTARKAVVRRAAAKKVAAKRATPKPAARTSSARAEPALTEAPAPVAPRPEPRRVAPEPAPVVKGPLALVALEDLVDPRPATATDRRPPTTRPSFRPGLVESVDGPDPRPSVDGNEPTTASAPNNGLARIRPTDRPRRTQPLRAT